MRIFVNFFCIILLGLPLAGIAQQKDSLRVSRITRVRGKVTDAASGEPLASITVVLAGDSHNTKTDGGGLFDLSTAGPATEIKFSHVGYKPVTCTISSGESQFLHISLESSQTQLNEVSIAASKHKRYKNKGNPAVELIQQVIDHKEANRMLNADYLQYDQYERIEFSLVNLSDKFLKGKFFRKYKFLLDTTRITEGKKTPVLPVYMSEKRYEIYSRKNPSKLISILKAHKEVDFSKYIDTAGVDIYLNRLYGNVDIYANNIFILTNQFLSPVADHAPAFYKFFITDTLKTGKEKLIELSFIPRNSGDLLFEGKLYVTMDGRYSIRSVDLSINKQINLNFVRSLSVHQDFEKYPDGRFYLVKSKVKSDFGLMDNIPAGISGERTVSFQHYQQSPQPASFYDGKSLQIAQDANQKAQEYWLHERMDTLSVEQDKIYAHIDSVKMMPSFRRSMWIASSLTGGYADLGPVQLGPIESTYSFNTVEGTRLKLGGRTTAAFHKSIYLEGYTAYGFKDQKLKYYLNAAYSFNQTTPYRFPNDYLKISYQYDTDIPGQNFLVDKAQSFLASIKRGQNNLWLYNRTLNVAYVKDFENHFSYNFGVVNRNQRPAGDLIFQRPSFPDQPIALLRTTELTLGLRYAPHEQIRQGTMYRHTIPSKYPIFTLQANYGMKGVLQNPYRYTNLSGNIYKRFYLSQLGNTDVMVLGGSVLGQVPFPLLSILPANQTYLYDAEAYNMMSFLEFVSDHYAGLNLTHNFEGFLLNKVPLLQRLKLHEYLSFKILYGGLRNGNNPAYNSSLYKFPVNSAGLPVTYALGNAPYTEAGVGIGNVFKIMRVDLIRRFNYLDHPGAAPYGLRFSFKPDL